MNSMPALLVVDVQVGLDDPVMGARNNPAAETNIERLIKHWREAAAEVIHVKHNSTEPQSPLRPESPGNAIKSCATPMVGEKLFEKCVNSAFIGTNLHEYLQEHRINQLVVIGLTTDHCVSTTVRMAENLAYEVWLVADATATFDRVGVDGQSLSAELMHSVNLASLNQEFCTVIDTHSALQLVSQTIER